MWHVSERESRGCVKEKWEKEKSKLASEGGDVGGLLNRDHHVADPLLSKNALTSNPTIPTYV